MPAQRREAMSSIPLRYVALLVSSFLSLHELVLLKATSHFIPIWKVYYSTSIWMQLQRNYQQKAGENFKPDKWLSQDESKKPLRQYLPPCLYREVFQHALSKTKSQSTCSGICSATFKMWTATARCERHFNQWCLQKRHLEVRQWCLGSWQESLQTLHYQRVSI